uniref:Neurotransmitter-gated ion-channel ligand-binding domain-containing protein n=1 Tax=Acrobeloides nanus TaxID=290746 RepID=A0A914EFE5_9BILA
MKQIPSGCVSFLVFLTKIIIITANLNITNESDIKNSTKTIIDIGDYLKNYNTNIRPTGENGTGPVKVQVDLFIRSISNVDEAKMEYSLQLTLRETWIDNRLAYGRDQENSSDYFVLGAEQEIWRPDTFIYV